MPLMRTWRRAFRGQTKLNYEMQKLHIEPSTELILSKAEGIRNRGSNQIYNVTSFSYSPAPSLVFL